jgi:hypothetical protein
MVSEREIAQGILGEGQTRAKQKAFEAWSSRSEVKLLISLLPPLESEQHKEFFGVLLRSAYDAGHDAGAGSTAASMVEALLTARMHRPS